MNCLNRLSDHQENLLGQKTEAEERLEVEEEEREDIGKYWSFKTVVLQSDSL